MAKSRQETVRAGRRAVLAGEIPRFEVSVATRTVIQMPWLEFDGDRPESIVEAGRRAIAAALGVRADQVQVDIGSTGHAESDGP